MKPACGIVIALLLITARSAYAFTWPGHTFALVSQPQPSPAGTAQASAPSERGGSPSPSVYDAGEFLRRAEDRVFRATFEAQRRIVVHDQSSPPRVTPKEQPTTQPTAVGRRARPAGPGSTGEREAEAAGRSSGPLFIGLAAGGVLVLIALGLALRTDHGA